MHLSQPSSASFRPGQTTSVDLSEFFKAVQLSTSLDRAQNVCITDSAAVAFQQLSDNRFDQAPVTDGGRVVGSVRTADLVGAANVAAVMKRLEDCPLLSMDAPLSVLLSALADSPMVFLLGPNGLQAFVTPSDLERHAARAHFCLLVSSIEILLADAVDSLGDEVVEAAIKRERKRWHQAQANGSEGRPVEYLNLNELIGLFTDELNETRGWPDRLTTALGKLTKLRNTVMHSVKPLSDHRSPHELPALNGPPLGNRAVRMTVP